MLLLISKVGGCDLLLLQMVFSNVAVGSPCFVVEGGVVEVGCEGTLELFVDIGPHGHRLCRHGVLGSTFTVQVGVGGTLGTEAAEVSTAVCGVLLKPAFVRAHNFASHHLGAGLYTLNGSKAMVLL